VYTDLLKFITAFIEKGTSQKFFSLYWKSWRI